MLKLEKKNRERPWSVWDCSTISIGKQLKKNWMSNSLFRCSKTPPLSWTSVFGAAPVEKRGAELKNTKQSSPK